MLILSRQDLNSLLKPEEWEIILDSLEHPGSEVLLFVCSNESLYLGFLELDSEKFMDFRRFSPSVTYRNLYHDLPTERLLPCPMCAQEPSVIRMERHAGKIYVYSS